MQRRSELVSVCVANDDNVSIIRWYNNRVVSIHDDFRNMRFNNNNISNSYATPASRPRTFNAYYNIFKRIHLSTADVISPCFGIAHRIENIHTNNARKIQNWQINRGREVYYYLSERCSDDCQCIISFLRSGKKK